MMESRCPKCFTENVTWAHVEWCNGVRGNMPPDKKYPCGVCGSEDHEGDVCPIMVERIKDLIAKSPSCPSCAAKDAEIKRLRVIAERANDIRPSVLNFAEMMETVLKKNDHKGGWDDCDWKYLRGRLKDELKELENAYAENNGEEVTREAVDVANFAMMIADNFGAWLKEAEKG